MKHSVRRVHNIPAGGEILVEKLTLNDDSARGAFVVKILEVYNQRLSMRIIVISDE